MNYIDLFMRNNNLNFNEVFTICNMQKTHEEIVFNSYGEKVEFKVTCGLTNFTPDLFLNIENIFINDSFDFYTENYDKVPRCTYEGILKGVIKIYKK